MHGDRVNVHVCGKCKEVIDSSKFEKLEASIYYHVVQAFYLKNSPVSTNLSANYENIYCLLFYAGQTIQLFSFSYLWPTFLIYTGRFCEFFKGISYTPSIHTIQYFKYTATQEK